MVVYKGFKACYIWQGRWKIFTNFGSGNYIVMTFSGIAELLKNIDAISK